MNRTMIFTLITAAFMAACTVLEPEPMIDLTASYSIIDGDTVKTRVEKDFKEYKKNDPNARNFIIVGDTVLTYKAPKLHTPPAKAPDLSKLKNNDDPDLKGKPLRMVAIGGSLTAGVRDGGYFNEGMLTSYPNLIARQMGIKFEQPLFDADSYNGFGRKVRTSFNPTGGPLPKFKNTENNSGIEFASKEEVKLKKYQKSQNVDIMAIPNMNRSVYRGGMSGFQYYDNATTNLIPYFKRVDKYEKNLGIAAKFAFSEKADLYTVETGLSDFVDLLLNKNIYSLGSLYSLENPIEENIAYVTVGKNDKGRKSKLCIANIPDIFDFPFFNLITKEMALKNYSGDRIPTRYNMTSIDDSYQKTLCFVPNSTFDSLLSPKVNVAFKDDIIRNRMNQLIIYDDKYINDTKSLAIQMNTTTLNISKSYGFPVADLYSLYKKIHQGGYFTEDGVKVNPAYPNGNFYSADGIYPTAFGNAVIANEFIKAINSYYKSEIPLIKTAEYLTK